MCSEILASVVLEINALFGIVRSILINTHVQTDNFGIRIKVIP